MQTPSKRLVMGPTGEFPRSSQALRVQGGSKAHGAGQDDVSLPASEHPLSAGLSGDATLITAATGQAAVTHTPQSPTRVLFHASWHRCVVVVQSPSHA